MVLRGEMARRGDARAAAVFEERLPRVVHPGTEGDGDLRAAGGEAGPDADSAFYDGIYNHLTGMGIAEIGLPMK
jgi:hypothetical protein